MSDFSGWSCDERDRKNCRNGHGCHCREITSLIERNTALERCETALRNLRIDPAIYAKPQDGGDVVANEDISTNPAPRLHAFKPRDGGETKR